MANNCTIIRMLVKDNLHGSVVTHDFAICNHWHDEMEFIYIDKGKLEIDIDGKMYSVVEGQMIIVSSNTMHAYMEVEPGTVIWVAKVHMKDISIFSDKNEYLTSIYRNTLIIKATDRMKSIVYELINAHYGNMNDCYSGIKISELTIELLNTQSAIKNYIQTRSVENTEKIYQMQEYIADNLCADLTLQMLADYLGFSTAYCSKYIKKKTNLNFLEYVNSLRLREAEELLQTTEMYITDIAYATGFKSIQSFNRIFKKYRGVIPSQYKKSIKNKK